VSFTLAQSGERHHMNKDQKSAVVDEIAEQLQGAEAIFAVDYRGISVPQAAELRARLRDADATFRIVKNRLTVRAVEKAGAEGLTELLEGPTALTFVRGDAALAAKALNDFSRAADVLEFKGGRMGDQVLTIDEIKSIARLPARDVLHGQLVGTIAAPITGLVRGLNALIGGIAIQLQAIHDQGLVTGEAPAQEAAPEAEAAPAEEAAPEEEAAPTPAKEAPGPADSPPAEETAPQEGTPAEEETITESQAEPAAEDSSAAEEAAPEEAAPAEEAAPEEPAPAAEPAADEPAPAEPAAEEPEPADTDSSAEGPEGEHSEEPAEGAEEKTDNAEPDADTA
jgi:large subunit ribosomal protein L10